MLNKKFYKTNALHFFKDLQPVLGQEIPKIRACELGSFEKLADKEKCQRWEMSLILYISIID